MVFKFFTVNRSIYLIDFLQSIGVFGLKFSLVLYLVNAMGVPDGRAYQIYAAFAAFAYGFSALFAYISEKFLGIKFAIYLGYILLFVAYVLMLSETYLSLAIAFFVFGISFYRTNLYDALGKFNQGDEKANFSAYNNLIIFFNIGAATGLIFIGTMIETNSWKIVFITLFVSSLFSFLIFALCADKIIARTSSFDWPQRLLSLVLILFCILCFAKVFDNLIYVDYLLFLLLAITICIYTYVVFQLENALQKSNIIKLGILFVFLIATNIAFEQIGTSLTLFIDRVVEREAYGFLVPTTWLLSVNPIFYTLIGAIVFIFTTQMKTQYLQKYIGILFIVCFLCLLVAYGALWLFSGQAEALMPFSMVLIVGTLFLYTLGEVAISPISLAMIYMLVPQKYTSYFVGIWFFVFCFGVYASGEVASFVKIDDISNIDSVLSVYHQFFSYMLIFLLANLFAFLVFNAFLLKSDKKNFFAKKC